MQQAFQQPNWQQTQFGHWLKHSLLPLLLLALFLLLPKPWITHSNKWLPTLEIELDQTPEAPVPIQPEPIQPQITEPKPIEHEPSKTKPDSRTAGGSPATKPKEVQISKPMEKLNEQPMEPSSKPATTSDILLSANNRVSMDIPIEFQARTGPAKDFYIPEQEIQDWLADIPFLDESIDRPTIEMKFYAEGFTGHIEKFFDKITIKKTFTTKYGTKIHCALIGVIAACGWK